MTRTISSGLNTALQSNVTTLALLWRVTRTDGTILRFTDANRPVVYEGQTYRADISFQASSIYTSNSLAKAQTFTLLFQMNDYGIKEFDIRSRLYDFAKTDIMIVDYNNPANGVCFIGTWLFSKVVISDKGVASVDLGPTSLLGLSLGFQVYSPTCRATFGDARCKIAVNPVSASAVLSVGGTAPGNNETVTIGPPGLTTVYTFKTVLTGAANEVLIGATSKTALANLIAAVNGSVGVGVTYGTGTIANSYVSAALGLNGSIGSVSFDSESAIKSGSWPVPTYNILTVEVWGPGSGGATWHTNSLAAGVSAVSTLSMTANGGGSTTGGESIGSPGVGAVGGTATGGNISNQTGHNGGNGQTTAFGTILSGLGGGAGPRFIDQPGIQATGLFRDQGLIGTSPGGGGSGATFGTIGEHDNGYAGGAGGGYAKSIYVLGSTAGAPTIASNLAWSLSPASKGAANSTVITSGINGVANVVPLPGGDGAVGRITFTWSADLATNATFTALVAGTAGNEITVASNSVQYTWTTPLLFGGQPGLALPFSVASVLNSTTFTAAAFTKPNSYFTQGYVQWTSGANVGTKFFILKNLVGNLSVTLVSTPQLPIRVGDTGMIFPGCDKLPETCRDRWANEINFRGEAAVPTQDIIPLLPVTGLQILQAS